MQEVGGGGCGRPGDDVGRRRLAAAFRLKDSIRDRRLERRGKLRHRFHVGRHFLEHIIEVFLQCPSDLGNVRTAVKEYLARRGVLEQSKKQVLEGHRLLVETGQLLTVS